MEILSHEQPPSSEQDDRLGSSNRLWDWRKGGRDTFPQTSRKSK